MFLYILMFFFNTLKTFESINVSINEAGFILCFSGNNQTWVSFKLQVLFKGSWKTQTTRGKEEEEEENTHRNSSDRNKVYITAQFLRVKDFSTKIRD